MTKIDQFESAFRAASKHRYAHHDVAIGSVMVLTDLDLEPARRFAADVRQYLAVLEQDATVAYREASCRAASGIGELLESVEQARPDLICTYRNLRGAARGYPFSLGSYVDVLTQATTTPVLLLPSPDADGRLAADCRGSRRVMVLTDVLTGADRLVDHGVRFAHPAGTLVLAHLEDDAVFERYLATIAKIPAIDTDLARQALVQQLLKEPQDYVASCTQDLARHRSDLTVLTEVTMGHRVADCQRLVEEHAIELLVLNTKDEDQLAMHGLAYPLAIELRSVPLLML